MKRVFVDGAVGTTGLRIVERLSERPDLELITLEEAVRKDPAARAEALNAADLVFLCLPDVAAREAVAMIDNPDTVVIDTSTAHRTAEGWVYGLPELTGLSERIKPAKRIANPGCHSTGFIALVQPLVAAGVLDKDAKLASFSLTGYSGGGKQMIADYKENPQLREAPRAYALSQQHKHIPEMTYYTGLTTAPVFTPIVANYYAGMEVTVPLHRSQINASVAEIGSIYADYYTGPMIRYAANIDDAGFVSADTHAGFDDMDVSVQGNEERMTLVARFDNLGKGASGAAIQNMNLALGIDETTGLNLRRTTLSKES
ncbi:MAG: N-acetyl-gamma-glutamyl-phosphate reductase [Actinomycetaceae bacterium]|nr:N-acetyl-gamma-glutamyl-phosphate reductase [Actinomycetaceae bacterium]